MKSARQSDPDPGPPDVDEETFEEEEHFEDFQEHALGDHLVHDPALEKQKSRVQEALAKKTYNVFDAYFEEGITQKIAKSALFENVTLSVIMLNGLWLAYDTDVNEASTLLDAEIQFQIAENIFCVYFVFEWTVRFAAFRNKCDGLQDGWFCFDSLLVALMVFDAWIVTIYQAVSGGSFGDTGFLSILRLFRLLRLLRMARMLRSMPELMILVNGMLAAMRSVFFVMCLLILIMYVFAIIFTQLAKGTTMGSFYFPNIQHSMYSLLIYGTFLDDLARFCDEIGRESYPCLGLVFLFILLASCTVLNMLIGVLCEVVSAVADNEKEEMNLAFVSDKLHSLLYNLDEDRDGHISKAEFMKILSFPEAVRALEEVEIDPIAVVDFADFIFGMGTGSNISFEEFMEVLLNLRSCNTATIRDIVDLKKHFVHMIGVLEQQLVAHNSRMFMIQGSAEAGGEPYAGPGTAIESAAITDLQGRTERLEGSLSTILEEFQSLVKSIPESDGLPRATVLTPGSPKTLRNASPMGPKRINSASRQ
mmetsp:Transcript_39677/g.71399  ORF Transcript_39677/g.71399 Transcript_39677/m.71399 type:complete len:534 (+) Transcript_39677:98-1699(+)|eukprot:CAMPEP_0197655396 /NCGR_PEP_ID=MMETSP1338-20131121/39427_1 /TAXON_ID=43686 ORGANISM="Pelagodinium beii, Strain RCC1491" /NCGR_SAMPLE_ID=MMETSP1338 /ASSEMBLY_ACC=CAM_ASM_000754 /LENGTH=533 /DNA_ID=CAMNT_0043231033 /DNA_START=98 /DNA_END=1699 /DNA_ORIENTATION=+